jgi:hypothetical protein
MRCHCSRTVPEHRWRLGLAGAGKNLEERRTRRMRERARAVQALSVMASGIGRAQAQRTVPLVVGLARWPPRRFLDPVRSASCNEELYALFDAPQPALKTVEIGVPP